jgi:hypothetical protein
MNPRLRAILVDDARRAMDRGKRADGETPKSTSPSVVVSEYVGRNLRRRPWSARRRNRD